MVKLSVLFLLLKNAFELISELGDDGRRDIAPHIQEELAAVEMGGCVAHSIKSALIEKRSALAIT